MPLYDTLKFLKKLNEKIISFYTQKSSTSFFLDLSKFPFIMSSDPSKLGAKKTEQSPSRTGNVPMRKPTDLLSTKKKLGIFTPSHLAACGFEYTGERDTTRCKECGLEISNWTRDMDLYKIHLEQKPDCPFIQSIRASSSSKRSSLSLPTTTVRNTSTANEHENPSKRQKIEPFGSESLSNSLLETDSIQQVRRRTFSHWPHHTKPSSEQMIEAGFFNCNVGDRVMCIYCNLICQQWTPHTDDPCEVHKTLSPNCPYVKAKLIRSSNSRVPVVNERSAGVTSNNHSTISANLQLLRSSPFVLTAARNPTYTEIPKRHASFATCPNENLPSVDDLVRAGFFYTGTKNIVTCFYCNGSLQNWGPNDNPMIEHARWFPHCAYAKQLCGDEMYRKIQESKRAQQGLFEHSKF
jgi:hypothetical protein